MSEEKAIFLFTTSILILLICIYDLGKAEITIKFSSKQIFCTLSEFQKQERIVFAINSSDSTAMTLCAAFLSTAIFLISCYLISSSGY